MEIIYWICGITGALVWIAIIILLILKVFKINVNKTINQTFVDGELVEQTINGEKIK